MPRRLKFRVSSLRWLPSRRWLALVALALSVFVAVEGVRWVNFYRHASAAQSSLQSMERRLDLSSLTDSHTEIVAVRAQLIEAQADLDAARGHVDHDPLLAVARRVPLLRGQATGLTQLVRAAHSSAATGVAATDVLLAYSAQDGQPDGDA